MQSSFVEFENGADLKTAVEKLDKREFKGATVHCSQDVSAGISFGTLLIAMICLCTSTHRSRTSVRLTRATVNALHHVADMELLVLMTTTRVDHLVVTVRGVTIGSARLVADQMTTTAEETMDGVHHREETRTDHRYHLDENHMATTHTTEVGRHHLGAMVPTLTSEMGIRILEGQGVHQGEAMEVATQPMRDTGEAPVSIYDSTLLASVESHFLEAYSHRSPAPYTHCRRTSFSLTNDGFGEGFQRSYRVGWWVEGSAEWFKKIAWRIWSLVWEWWVLTRDTEQHFHTHNLKAFPVKSAWLMSCGPVVIVKDP